MKHRAWIIAVAGITMLCHPLLAATARIDGVVRRTDGKPLSGAPVYLAEDPEWWSFFQPTVIHSVVRTDRRGRFSMPAPRKRIGGHFTLGVVGRVITTRASQSTSVVRGTDVSTRRISFTSPNIIVVPTTFQPGPMIQPTI